MAAAASTTNFNFGNDSISSFTNTLQKQQSNLIWKYLDTSNLLDGSDLSNFHYGGANGGGSKILGPYLNNQRLFQQTPHDIHMTNYNAFSQQQQQHDHLQHYHHPSIRRHNSVGNLNLPISNYTNNPSSSQLQISDITNTASGNMGGMIGALDLSRPYVQEAGENFMSAEQYLGIVEMEWQSIL